MLNEQQVQELEDALDAMAAKKSDLLALKGTRHEAEAKDNLLRAVDGVNKVCKSFEEVLNNV